MAKRALPLLTGGLNEVTRSDLIEDSQLQQCDNYEITGDGVLRKRKGQTSYDYSLNVKLSDVFSSVLKISEPYYPQKKLESIESENYSMMDDFILFVVGLTSSDDTEYTIHAFYRSGAVTGTCNLPNGTSEENISEVSCNILIDQILLSGGLHPYNFTYVNPGADEIPHLKLSEFTEVDPFNLGWVSSEDNGYIGKTVIRRTGTGTEEIGYIHKWYMVGQHDTSATDTAIVVLVETSPGDEIPMLFSHGDILEINDIVPPSPHSWTQNSDIIESSWSNYVFWSAENEATTFSTLLSQARIKYPIASVTASDIEFTMGNNKVIISDGYNRLHFFEIDADGIATTGFLGIPAPKNIPKVISPEDSSVRRGNISNLDVDFEDDSGANYVEAPGLAQVTYTVVTKHGEESNPSPISDALDLQWFKLNEDTGANERWINSIKIYNLNIPDVPESIKNLIEKFRIYLRVTPYSQGDTAKILTFTEEFDISNKTIDATDTGNDYRMTIHPTTGQTVSYENDIAPVAKTTSELGGIIMAGNVSFGHTFPFKFKYVHRIELNNKDSNFYVEPWFRIRLGDKNSTSIANDAVNAPPIENLTLTDFINIGTITANTTHLRRSEFIRIYFEDQTTPCMLGYVNRVDNEGNSVSLNNNTDVEYIDLLIKVPYLRANDSTSIYLVWTPENTEDEELYPGVPDQYNAIGEAALGTCTLFYVDAAGGGQTTLPDLKTENNCLYIAEYDPGVDSVSWTSTQAEILDIGFDYGRIVRLGFDHYDRHKLFPETRILDDQTVLAFDFSFKNRAGESFNKADGNGVIVKQGDIPQQEHITQLTAISPYFAVLFVLGYKNYTILNPDLPTEEGIYQNFLSLDNLYSGVVLNNPFFRNTPLLGKSGFVSFWHYLKNPNKDLAYEQGEFGAPNDYSQYNICSLWADTGLGIDDNTDYSSEKKVLRLYIAPSTDNLGNDQQTLHIDDNRGFTFDGANSTDIDSEIILYHDVAVGDSWYGKEVSKSMFIMIGWNSEMSKVSIWARGEDGTVYSKSMDIPSTWNKITDGSFNGLVLGSHTGEDTPDQLQNPRYADVTMQLGKYLDAEDDDDYSRFINYSNRGGVFEEVIGYKENETSDSTSNNNLSFTETNEIAGKQQNNMVKWTDVNHTSFPDLNFKAVKESVKKIIPAPSFLQYQYQNTFLIFTRNTINRFILEGSASGWAANAGSLIEEKKQYGLLADKSLLRIGDAVFWLSEVGVVKWDSQGLNLISKNIVNVLIDENSIAFYNSINNQYMLHQPNNETYVYHIDRNMWTKYTGLNIKSTAILTGGTVLDNINLLLRGNNEIDKFPSADYTAEESTIKTKDLFFENGLLKRVRMDYSGLSTEHLFTQDWAEGTVNIIKLLGFETDDPWNMGWISYTDNGYIGLEVFNVTTGASGLIDSWYLFESNDPNAEYPIYIKVTLENNIAYNPGDTIKIPGIGAVIGNASLTTNLTKIDNNGLEIVKSHTIDNIHPNKWRGIKNGKNRGRSVNIEVKNAEKINSIMYDLNIESEVTT